MVNIIIFFIFLIFSGFYFFRQEYAKFFIFSLIGLTAVSGLLVGREVEIVDIHDFLFMIYVIIFLFVFVYFSTFWLSRYKKNDLLCDFPNYNPVGVGLIFVLLPVLLINIYIFYHSINIVVIDAIVDIDEYKNEGGVDEYLRARVGSLPLFISRALSPLAFFCIPLSILSLVNSNNKLCFLLLICSLNWVLLSLMSFSRSGLMSYLLLVAILYMSFWSYFNYRGRRLILNITILPIISAIIMIVFISTERFDDENYWVFKHSEDTLINNVIWFSIFDYFSQWLEHSFILYKSNDFSLFFHGNHLVTLFHQLNFPIISDQISWVDFRYQNMGQFSSYFVGLPYIFYIDFGFFGLIIILYLMTFFTILSLYNNFLRSLYFIISPFLVMVSCMFFSDSHFAYTYVQQAAVYSLILFIFIRYKYKFR